MPSRRTFLRLAATSVGGATAVGLYTWRIEPHWLEVVRRPLRIRRLPPRLWGRTLIQLSDVHVGPRVDDEYLLATFRRVADLRPDIVVLTGDLSSYHSDMFEHVRRVYQYFPKGRLATLATLGNHDYGPRWAYPQIAQRITEDVQALGVRMLRNQIHDVEGLQIAGLDDLWAKRFVPDIVLPKLDPHRGAIVLSHNPDTADCPGWDGYEGWILAGHTHGGQCKPPFLAPPLLPVRNRRYTSGEFSLAGGRHLYISRGVGHLLHVRFNVRPEVTLFELRPA